MAQAASDDLGGDVQGSQDGKQAERGDGEDLQGVAGGFEVIVHGEYSVGFQCRQ